MIPKLPIKSLPLLLVILKSVLFPNTKEKTRITFLPQLIQSRIMLLSMLLFLPRKRLFPHRNSQIRRPLKNFQRLNIRTPFLGNLHARSTSSDDGTALAADVYAFFGPEGGVVDGALEGF
jgi:hypothetical protein